MRPIVPPCRGPMPGSPPQRNAPAACISLAAAGIGEAQAELALGGRIAVSEIGQHGLKVANGEAEPFRVQSCTTKERGSW